MKTFLFVYECTRLTWGDDYNAGPLDKKVTSLQVETIVEESLEDALDSFTVMCNEGISEWYWLNVRPVQILEYDFVEGKTRPTNKIYSDMTPFEKIFSGIESSN